MLVTGTTKSNKIELAIGLLLIGILLYTMRSVLTGQTSFMGDTLNAEYPFFHFFTEQLFNKSFPLWDPFTHGGQPIYPTLLHKRFLDPIFFLGALIGPFFSKNTLVLFSWTFITQTLVMLLGFYLYLRKQTDNLIFRLSLMPILLFGSFMYCSFLQGGALHHTVWLPWILLLLDRIFFEHRYDTKTLVATALLIGLQCQGYWIATTALLIFIYLCSLTLFYRRELKRAYQALRKNSAFLVCVAIVVAMLTPNLVVLLESNRYVFPIRMTEEEFLNPSRGETQNHVSMDVKKVAQTGASSTLWNYLWLLFPYRWGEPSEIYLFPGHLVWLIALFGFCFATNKKMKVWGILLVGFVLLSLGEKGGLYPLFSQLFPPLKLIRHTSQLSLFALFLILVFFLEGLKALANFYRGKLHIKMPGTWDFVIGLISFIVLLVSFLLALNFPLSIDIHQRPVIVASVCILFLLFKLVNRLVFFVLTAVLAFTIVSLRVPVQSLFLNEHFALVILPGVIFLLACQFRYLQMTSKLLYGLFVLITLVSAHASSDFFSGLYYYIPQFRRVPVNESIEPLKFGKTRTVSPFGDKFMGGEVNSFSNFLTRRVSLYNYDSPHTLKEAWGNKWRSPYLMNRESYLLLLTPLPLSVLEETFAIEKSLFQLKSVSKYIPLDKTLEYWQGLSPSAASEELRSTVLLHNPSVQVTAKLQTTSFEYSVDYDSHNHLKVHTKSNGPGFLFWSDSFDPWWKAKIDGINAPILRANYAFKALPLTAGENAVEFTYRPWPFILAIVLFALTLLLGICYLLFLPVSVSLSVFSLKKKGYAVQ